MVMPRHTSQKAAITVHHSRDEIERLWREHSPVEDADVTFADAPGDRGTEIHVELKGGSAAPRAKLKDQLRRFKQQIETGQIPRSEGTPEGEAVERKFKQRPAQP